ncbi:hypothetical protein CN884_02060 [Ochrobactrum sp. 30A/1000/2015]|nr:hypothetical protein CN884_02060 [Ochrobactrum sp. 30A/1000/2015]PJT38628.1 hypothetical protein CN883_12675 [Ochrobactrum sp. 27A/999/2015]PJT44644.1 hypothetical protein CN882_02060 [Ochrobactrum sp. 23A/997/2015]
MSSPSILYLDQNMWIAVAQGVKDPGRYPEAYAVVELLVALGMAGEFTIPLSFTNIYETHKVNDPDRRAHLAWVQASLSQGKVFRGRRALLREQLIDHLSIVFSIAGPTRSHQWFLSEVFFEAVADYDPEVFGVTLSDRFMTWIRDDPPRALFSYLTDKSETNRASAVRKYSAGSSDLIARLEAQRELVNGESLAMRKRVHSARLLIDHLDLIFSLARELSLPISTVSDLGRSRARALVAQVPAFHIERELAAITENEMRSINENDLRDLAALNIVLPYADIVVGEKAFINRARQARLGNHYGTILLTSISELREHLLDMAESIKQNSSEVGRIAHQ